MVARIAGFAAEANQTLQFHSVQFRGLPSQISALGVVQDRLISPVIVAAALAGCSPYNFGPEILCGS
jgi:hypothetical protein